MATATAQHTNRQTEAKTRQVLSNPFRIGEQIVIPAGTVFTSTNPAAKGRQLVKRAHKVTVHDSIPARVQPRKSEKGSQVLIRPVRIRAKGSGGYWKDITLTEKVIRFNGRTVSYENLPVTPETASTSANTE